MHRDKRRYKETRNSKEPRADHIIELGDFDITEAIREANEGLLPDIVFEASGHHSAVQMCLNSVRKHGQVIFIGLQHHDLQINLLMLSEKKLFLREAYAIPGRNLRNVLIWLIRAG